MQPICPGSAFLGTFKIDKKVYHSRCRERLFTNTGGVDDKQASRRASVGQTANTPDTFVATARGVRGIKGYLDTDTAF